MREKVTEILKLKLEPDDVVGYTSKIAFAAVGFQHDISGVLGAYR
jgi:hypothetical protein